MDRLEALELRLKLRHFALTPEQLIKVYGKFLPKEALDNVKLLEQIEKLKLTNNQLACAALQEQIQANKKIVQLKIQLLEALLECYDEPDELISLVEAIIAKAKAEAKTQT